MPYIPEEHKKFGVLPYCVEHGGEVFCYPSELIDEIESYYTDDINLIPYGYDSYEEYNEFLRKYQFEAEDEHLKSLFDKLIYNITVLNRKEEWSICRYVGKRLPTVKGLEPGQCYYWPCQADDPVYGGVIDNEEFTSYWYPTEKDLWEIVWDPTGMAKKEIDNASIENSRDNFNSVMRSLNGDDWSDI